MRVDQLFDLRYGQSLELVRLKETPAPKGVNFVSRSMFNNGVTARVEVPSNTQDIGQAGEITVALGGNVLSTFVQPEPFITGFHVMILKPKNKEMSLQERLWWASCIWMNRFRYSYGRQANRTLGELELPDSVPSWVFESEIPDFSSLAGETKTLADFEDISRWIAFRVDEIFTVTAGKYVKAVLKTPGDTPEVTSTAKNNGVARYISLEPNSKSGSISVARNGSVGKAFYQPQDFFATDDVRVWSAKKGSLSPAEGLFICEVIELERFRYTYGRKWNLPQMRETEIRLPAKADGSPDWAHMEKLILELPFASIAYRHSPHFLFLGGLLYEGGG